MIIERGALFEDGFAVIDALVAILLVCIGVEGISSFLNYAAQAQFGTETAAQFYNLKMDIKTILSSAGTCTPNFPATDPNSFTTPKSVTLQRFDYTSGAPVAMTGPNSTIGSVGSKYGALTVLSGQVRKKQQIATNLYMMAYQVTVARDPNATGARQLMTEIPFSMLIDVSTGQVTRCFTDPFTVGSALLESFVCVLASGDQQYFDPVSQTCTTKYVDQPTLGINAYKAGPCLTGSTFNGCTIVGANSSGAGAVASQTYSGYGPLTAAVPGTQAGPDSSNPGHCACSYSSTYVFGGSEKCAVVCQTLNPALVNIWPYQPGNN